MYIYHRIQCIAQYSRKLSREGGIDHSVNLRGKVEENVQLPVVEVCVEDAVAGVVVVGGRVAVAGLVPEVHLLVPPQKHGGGHAVARPATKKGYSVVGPNKTFRFFASYQMLPTFPAYPSMMFTRSVPKPAARSEAALIKKKMTILQNSSELFFSGESNLLA